MIVKSRGEAGRGAELSEQPVPGGVERSAVHPRAAPTDESLGAGEHLLRGAAREGEEEDALGRDAALDQVRDAVDERARFARARAGDDEQRPVAEGDGARLLRIEGGRERRLVRGGKLSRARAVEARLVRHSPEYTSAPERPPNASALGGANPVPSRCRCSGYATRCRACGCMSATSSAKTSPKAAPTLAFTFASRASESATVLAAPLQLATD